MRFFFSAGAPVPAVSPRRVPRARRSVRLLGFASLCLPLALDAVGATTLADAVYTRDQARDGKKLYQQHCLACHERGYFREVLRVRQGETLEPIFEVMVTQMPQNAPGSLTDAQYVDVIAYMLSQSRYAAGDKPLKVVDLSEIHIPPPD